MEKPATGAKGENCMFKEKLGRSTHYQDVYFSRNYHHGCQARYDDERTPA